MASSDVSAHPRKGLRLGLRAAGAGATALVALGVAGTTNHSVAADFSNTLMGGDAYGAGGFWLVGDVGYEAIPCQPASGTTYRNIWAAEKIPTAGAFTADQIHDEGTPVATASYADSVESSTLSNVSALGGKVQATSVRSVAHTRLDSSGQHNDGSVTVQGLLINGQPITISAANQEVDLPGGISVILNEQAPTSGGIVVNAIHVRSATNPAANGIIGHAETLAGGPLGPVSGYAFAAAGSVQPISAVGRQNSVSLPCGGSHGLDISQTQLQTPPLTAGGHTLLSEGSMVSTVNGDTSPTASQSHSREVIQAVSLLDGLIHANTVTAVASTQSTAAGVASSGEGTNFNDLTVGPFTNLSLVAPNTEIPLAGVGTAVLNEQVCTSDLDNPSAAHDSCLGTISDAITTTAIDVKVTQPNPYNLPVGAEILVGSAHSGVTLPQ